MRSRVHTHRLIYCLSLFLLFATNHAAVAAVSNPNSGTFAEGVIFGGEAFVAFDSTNAASAGDFDRGVAGEPGQDLNAGCGAVRSLADAFTPNNPPAGFARAHDVSAGASGTVNTLTFAAGSDDVLAPGPYCLYLDSGGGYWSILRTAVADTSDAGITACAPDDKFSPATGCAPNTPPNADAGADQTVAGGATVTLDGTGSFDANGDTLTYNWTQTGGPPVILTDNNSTTAVQPMFDAPVATDSAQVLTFELVVNDGTVDSVADTVTVTVDAVQAPVNVVRGTITIVKNTAPAVAGDGTFTFSSSAAGLNGLTVTTAGGSGRAAKVRLDAGTITVTENVTPGWQLKSISCRGDADGGSVVNVAGRRVRIDLDADENIVCTFTNERDPEAVRSRTQRVISNFMSRRADQITASDPDLVQRLTNRGTASSGSNGPVAFNGTTGTDANNQVAFSTSLRQVMASSGAAKDKRREELGRMMGLGQHSLNGAAIQDRSGFDIWVEGKWAHVDDDARQTDIGLLYVGVDYRLSPTVVVGMLTQFDWSDESDDVANTAADGWGWLTGPYAVVRLHENLIFDGRAAWGQSDNNVDPLGLYTDSFDAERWLVRARLTGDFQYNNWQFAPHVGVIYFEEEQESYTDSLGIFIPGQSVSLGRLTFGPKLSYRSMQANGTAITPHVAIKGIWDFDEAEIVDIGTGLAVGSDTLRGRVEAGLSASFANSWSISGEGFYDGIGADDLDVYGGSVKLSVPLN